MDQPMLYEARAPWSDIAASAYRAYAASTGNKDFRGEPMPAFEDLPRPIQVAWEAASRHVGDCLFSSDPITEESEQRWNGWEPPR